MNSVLVEKARPRRAKIVPAGNSILLPYQAKWVADRSRLKIAEKSRQIGWTWAAACGLVLRKSLEDAPCDAWVSSRDELQAQLFIEDCKGFADVYELASVATDVALLAPKGATDRELRFANGRRIHSLSSNPDAQAGKRGDRILDEFALHEEPRKLFTVAQPGITWAGSMEIFSTHRGTRNFFNELINEVKHNGNPKGFSLHSVTLEDALCQGLLYKLQSKLPADDARQELDEGEYFDLIRRTCADEESFREEFCCQPSDENGAFLSYDLIASCEYRPGERWEMEGDGTAAYYAGVDIGRDRDLTVIWVVEKVSSVYLTRRIVALDRQTFDAQEKELYALLDNPAVRRCCIDQTGMGRQFAERAQRKYGKYRVEGLTFTAGVKEELAYPVRAAFEDRAVRIPGDAKIRADLRNIRKETTASGNIRFTGERTANGHSDRFWALALALHAGKEATEQKIWAAVC